MGKTGYRMKRTTSLAMATGVAFLVGSLFSPIVGRIFNVQTSVQQAQAEPQPPNSFAELAETAKPSVVNISTTRVVRQRQFLFPPSPGPRGRPDDPFSRFFGDDFWDQFLGRRAPREFKERSLGSGFLIDREGHIITNNHVVQGADDIKVKLQNGKELKATIIGRDIKTDIALLRVSPAPNLSPARLGDSDHLKVGEWVIAIGNPFGLEQTVTAGIISAKDRVIGSGPYDDFIQTDASINPGNSGGPLFNTKGEVVGVSTAIFSQSGGNIGIGFAIPINLAKDIAEQLKNGGRVQRGWLGLAIQPVTEELAASLNLPGTKGALVADVVSQGPAERSGIRRGDVIVEFGGTEVKDSRDLSQMAAKASPGKPVEIKAIRDGKAKTFTVEIGNYPEDEHGRSRESSSEKPRLGLSFETLSPALARRYGIEHGETGVVVTAVAPDSPAAEAGIREGDIILEIDRRKVNQASDVNQALSKIAKGEAVLFLLKREGQTLFAAVNLTSPVY